MNLTTLQFQTNPKIEGLWTHYRMDAPPTIDSDDNVSDDVDERATNKEGYVAFGYVPEGQAYLLLRGKRFGFTDQIVGPIAMPQDHNGDPLQIELVRAPLARLVRIEGHRMVTEDGMPVYGRMASEFLLYKKYLEGEASIRPVLEQLADLGGNVVRVMGMFESLGGFNPKNYGDRYYDAIPGFCALCAEYGIYVYWVACAATGSMFTGDEALRHTQRTAEQLVTTQNAIFSYVNEQGQHNNSVDRERFRREVNTGWMLYDTGSFGADLTCDPPYGTHACLHVRRVYPASIKDGCIVDNGNYVDDHLQVWIDEPDRYGDDGNRSVEQAGDAAGTAYTALGWCFHSMQGERGEVLTGNTLDCARAAFGAMAR